ncbi:hypothetical protein F7R25_03785 [Burkholderia stagnalis]|uniref:Uncharacterized protein n=1 Tax=Burkholderia stagnalis TaxID=1503054 RepID=A0A6L3N2W8_9BURK|nr:hypothetical protein [Burkholderia stagnalis]KAB0640625.1 hypothetical protein F7R25_03785 [Burkholderia stagnalis]
MTKKEGHTRTLKLTRYPKTSQHLTEIAHYFEISRSLALQVVLACEHGVFSRKGRLRRFEPTTNEEAAVHFWHHYEKEEEEKLVEILKQQEIYYTGLVKNAIASFHTKMTKGQINTYKKEFVHYVPIGFVRRK